MSSEESATVDEMVATVNKVAAVEDTMAAFVAKVAAPDDLMATAVAQLPPRSPPRRAVAGAKVMAGSEDSGRQLVREESVRAG